MIRPPILAALLCLTPALSLAHDATPQYNRVSLSESAETEVDNDLLVAVLFAQAEGRDAKTPANQVNQLMTWALDLAKGQKDVKVQTLGYRTHAVYNKNKIRGWRVNQSVRLESTDGRLLGDLVAQLQDRLQMQSIAYQVSDEQRRKHLDDLTEQALGRFQQRARHIAKSLGRSDYRVVRLNINDGHQRPAPMARGMMMADSAERSVAPARLEAGTQKMNVAVNGEIELSEN